MVFKFYIVSYFMFIPGLIGGSTDLASSNKVYLKNSKISSSQKVHRAETSIIVCKFSGGGKE